MIKSDREQEVHTATYGPGIDQSLHAKSVSHIIITSYWPSARSVRQVMIKSDREQEVHTATYGPGIDQSLHAKSVSHIIITSY